MDDFKLKLQEGITSLAEAGHDPDKLGAALVKVHGALEDYFRQRLHPKMAGEELERSLARQLGWVELVNLWERHFGLPMEQRRTILTMNGQRNDFAHGKSLTADRHEIEEYARFVQQFTGTRLRPQRSFAQGAQASPLIVDSDDARIDDVVLPRDWRPWGRRLGQVALLGFAGVTLLLLNGWLETAVLLLLIAIPLFRQQKGRAVYNYLGGLMFGYLQRTVGLALLLAAFGGLLWPLALGGLLMQDRLVEFVETVTEPLPTPTGDATDATPVLQDEPVTDETAVPASTPSPTDTTTNATRLQIRGNSNVRAGPGTNFDLVGYAQNGETYDILETSQDRDWYKIQLGNGREGWIGSSRVQLINP
ncbi:MAG: SH3 domain-containing protein [Chloroflexota bacterium]